MPHRNASFFHLHLVSDSTGETLITVARAACAQYVNAAPVEHVYPAVRTSKQLDRVLHEIEAAPGMILYTLLDDSLIERLEGKCRELSLPCLSILGPVLRPVPVLSRRRNDPQGRGPAHAQCRILQADRRPQLHDDA